MIVRFCISIFFLFSLIFLTCNKDTPEPDCISLVEGVGPEVLEFLKTPVGGFRDSMLVFEPIGITFSENLRVFFQSTGEEFSTNNDFRVVDPKVAPDIFDGWIVQFQPQSGGELSAVLVIEFTPPPATPDQCFNFQRTTIQVSGEGVE